MKANNQSHRERRTSPSSPSPLTGLRFDAAGFRYTPTHAVKAGKRYRYYTSQAAIRRVSGATGIPRIPAHDIEKIVKTRIQSLLAAPGPLLNGSRRSPEAEAFRDAARRKAKTWPKLSGVEQNEFLRKVARRVVLGQSTLLIRLSRQAVIQAVTGSSPDHMARRDRVAAGTHDTFELTCEMRTMQHAGVVHLEPADEKGRAEPMRSTSLIKAIARARMWYEKLLSGDVQTFRTIAAQTGMTQRYISRILKGALLAPELVEAVLDGRQPAEMSFERLTTNLPLAWSAQTRCWQGARFYSGLKGAKQISSAAPV